MPAPLELSGRRFGKLLVLRRTSNAPRGGEWLCKCECGQEEVFPARRLPHTESSARRSDVVTACSVCMRTRTCASCGKSFFSKQYKACCSSECHLAHRRAKDLHHYHTHKKIKNPDLNKQRWERVKARIQTDPEFAAQWQQKERERYQRRRERLQSDLEYAERVREAARERYAAYAENIQARRRQRMAERLAAMTPEERDAFAAHRQAMNNRWRREWMQDMRANNYAEYRRLMDSVNEYKRQVWRQKKAIAELQLVAAELEKRRTK